MSNEDGPSPFKACVWTRARTDWSSDELLLGASALAAYARILHYPCLELHPVNPRHPQSPLWEHRSFTHAVITSRSAVHFACQVPELHQILKRVSLIYTHGEATAAALKELALPVQLVKGARTAEELAAQIVQLAPPAASFLIPSTEAPAFDMQAALAAQGHEAAQIVCYRTLIQMQQASGGALDETQSEHLIMNLSGVVCFASPSAVQAFTSALRPSHNALHERLIAVTIGPSTAKACEGHFARIETAAENQLTSLIKKAEEVLR